MKLFTRVSSDLVDGPSAPMWADGPTKVTIQLVSGTGIAYLEGSISGESWYSMSASVQNGTPLATTATNAPLAAFLRVRFDLPDGATAPVVVALAAE